MDIQDSNGTAPARPSASTQALNTSSSCNTKLTGTAPSLTEHVFGDEVEINSLLILDQHTFEGIYNFTATLL